MSSIRLKSVVALAFCCALAVPAIAADTPDAEAIQAAFAEYRAALLKGDGAKAADVVSARTIAYYGDILTHSLKMPRAQLKELDFIAKFMILRARHEFTKAQIEKMTGRDFLALGVERGWISKTSVANMDRLVGIKVSGASATASMPMAPGVPAFHFQKEAGQWRLDLTGSFPLAIAAMKQEIAKTGMSEDEFITLTLSMLSSKKVDESIYSPPK